MTGSVRYRRLARLRIAAQAAALVSFALLFVFFSGRYVASVSPLLSGLALAAGAVSWLMLVALVVLLVSAAAGRWFCGWLCPTGALQQMFAWLGGKAQRPRPGRVSTLLYLKYFLLAALAPGLLFGLSWAGMLDPLALLTRGLAAGSGQFQLHPADNYLPTTASSLEAMLLALIILLSLAHTRLWCRYLCPLGALLGVAGAASQVKISRGDSCDGCNSCSKVCQHGCIDGKRWISSECNYCLNCLAECPHESLSLRLGGAEPGSSRMPSASRRGFIGALGAGLVLPTLVRRRSFEARGYDPRLIRPPGAAEEQRFMGLCTRCGACEQTCPTGVIRPALAEAGFEGLFTPRLDFSTNYCRLECNECAVACHSGALESFHPAVRAPAAKDPIVLGVATIKKDRCLPWAYGLSCITCNEFCPTSPKAIKLVEGPKPGVLLPEIDPKICVGCGACELVCPLPHTAAIVTSANESRNPGNKITL